MIVDSEMFVDSEMLVDSRINFILVRDQLSSSTFLTLSAKLFERLHRVIDPILLHKRRTKESLDCSVEQSRIVKRHHGSCVRKDAKLTVRNVMIDLDCMLIADEVVIARHHKRRRRNRLERLQLDVRLLEHHPCDLQFAPG